MGNIMFRNHNPPASLANNPNTTKRVKLQEWLFIPLKKYVSLFQVCFLNINST